MYVSINKQLTSFQNCVTPSVSGPLTFWEECRLRVFDTGVLKRIFGPKRDEVIEKWRRLHNEELYDLCSSPNIIRVIKSRRMRWARHVARMGEEDRCMQGFGRKTGGKENAWNTHA